MTVACGMPKPTEIDGGRGATTTTWGDGTYAWTRTSWPTRTTGGAGARTRTTGSTTATSTDARGANPSTTTTAGGDGSPTSPTWRSKRADGVTTNGVTAT